MDESPVSPPDVSDPASHPVPGDLWQTSSPFIGDWNRLVSRTNWEKGRIILNWRQALQQSGVPASEYSDESWSRLVGGVSGQHAGRLRRVYQRFGETFEQYEGLYWSHFHAAIDWDDAEMWLEGAVHSKWSVSQMRGTRWQTLTGTEPPSEPTPAESEKDLDEDFTEVTAESSLPETISGVVQQVSTEEAAAHSPTPAKQEQSRSATSPTVPGAEIYADDDKEGIQFVRPFENLGQLPDDLASAFEEFKLVILRHKSEDWQRISRDDLLAALQALRELVLAPADDTPPF